MLYAFFFLLSALWYLRALAAGPERSRRWRFASLLAFAAALLSKSAAMTLPLTLLVVDVYPLRRLPRSRWRRLVVEKLPYLALAAAGAAVAVIAVARGTYFTAYGTYGPGARVAMVTYNLAFYPATWLVPVGLSPLYELPPHIDPFAARFLIPMIALAVVTAALMGLRGRWPGALAAWLYSALMILPVSGAVHAGFQLAHDRYSYVSGLGFALLAGGVLAHVLARRSRFASAIAGTLAGLVVAALGIAAWHQAAFWRDSVTLWQRAIAVEPGCVLCRSNLGTAWLDRGRAVEAEQAYRAAIALDSRRAATHNNLASALSAQGRHGEAEAELREALRFEPTLVPATANLGSLWARQRRWDDAIPLLREALRARPQAADVRRNLGLALRMHGAELAAADRPDAAVVRLREASDVRPEDPEVHRLLGQALLQRGETPAAIGALVRAVTLAPDRAPASR